LSATGAAGAGEGAGAARPGLPDCFTDKLMWAGFDGSQRMEIMEEGHWTRPSADDPAGYPITRDLIVEGRTWMRRQRRRSQSTCPCASSRAGLDPDVPWTHPLDLADKLRSEDVAWSLIKDGDHRLSRPQDIERMVGTVLDVAELVDAA